MTSRFRRFTVYSDVGDVCGDAFGDGVLDGVRGEVVYCDCGGGVEVCVVDCVFGCEGGED